MRYFPYNEELTENHTIQSKIFGHRFKTDQTVDEYLLEFLQVMISKKNICYAGEEKECNEYFPKINEELLKKIEFKPKPKIDLKRLTFYMKSKDDTRSEIDTDAYNSMIDFIKDKVDYEKDKEEIVQYIENLLYGFSGVIKNRSWFAQSFLPVCKSMVLPETMIDKKKRKKLDQKFKESNLKYREMEDYKKVDTEFEPNRYNFMARGGEVYYLHVLRGLMKRPDLKEELEGLFDKQLNEFKQIENLCDTIHKIWIEGISDKRKGDFEKDIRKTLGTIPVEFGNREEYTVNELINFLKSDMHPFEKIELLSQGIVLQLINLMHSEARYGTLNTRPAWVVDMTCTISKDKEMKKIAVRSYEKLEEDMTNKISQMMNAHEEEVKKSGKAFNREKAFKDAIDDSYKLCRKLAKAIGILVPLKGEGMRLTLQENTLKFLVTSIIKPGDKLTLTTFIEQLYDHFGIVVGRKEYKKEMQKGNVEIVSDFSFLDKNENSLKEMLKRCGFLRDLSDATAIVENPY
ncbi:Uncharacterised protein [Clostridium baratii]|uniref:hypothetical protein n=1 Tax=Clostridium baratii TaxID=1561 RepID=UPI0006C45ECA|nr:hypothetical protein [Clostridium baratii]CUP17216.1 Uncharacterised protein [Clostridium baratii]